MERINKFLAHAGLGSRRHCEDLVLAGRVRIDGEPVRDLAVRVRDGQAVTVDGKPIAAEKHVYWAVHKPRGYLSTNRDPAGRPRAIDLVSHVGQRIYTVGRLDEDSEGLLIMTNDGDLANKLMHPRYGVEKTYNVQVAGSPTREDLAKLTEGIWLSEGRVKARSARKFKSQGQSAWLRIVLAEGKNREVRRMLARLGHKVMRLIRVGMGPIELGKLKAGRNRPLNNVEVKKLRRLAESIVATEKAAEEGLE
ncbi:MAG: rRNA pseudouridine synthase [Gemmataceae bacterium]|nr:rRNA pseudouridine synthase [Gemmataceae bacterium]